MNSLNSSNHLSDFNILGMNVGANQYDYTLLHNQLNLSSNDNVLNLWQAYQSTQTCEKEVIEQKLFICMQMINQIGKEIPKEEAFAQLLFEKGIDILESKFIPEQYEDQYRELLSSHLSNLLKVLNGRILDSAGAEKFKEQYPNFIQFLQNNYNELLPKILKIESSIRKIEGSGNQYLEINHPFSGQIVGPLQVQLQKIKVDLATHYFEEITSHHDRPAIIVLQEVYTLNSNILDIFRQEDYTVFHPDGKSDTTIAIDTNKFDIVASYLDLEYQITAVAVTNKETQENFLILSVHILGYKLEFPEEMNDLPLHLQNVEKRIETATFPETEKLHQIIRELKKKHPDAKIIVEGDFNSYPEFFKNDKIPVDSKIREMDIFSTLQHPFVEHQNEKLTLFRSKQPTELNTKVPSLNERELDYFFVSESLMDRVKFLKPEDQKLTLAKVTQTGVHFDPMLLFSDHRPLWIKVSPPLSL